MPSISIRSIPDQTNTTPPTPQSSLVIKQNTPCHRRAPLHQHRLRPPRSLKLQTSATSPSGTQRLLLRVMDVIQTLIGRKLSITGIFHTSSLERLSARHCAMSRLSPVVMIYANNSNPTSRPHVRTWRTRNYRCYSPKLIRPNLSE